VQGLVAQGRTIQEAIEIARDVAKKLLEARDGCDAALQLRQVAEDFDYPLIVNT
jgi:predicted RNase H-like HicB family nuclease